MSVSTAAYFERIGPGRYRPTHHAGGAWTDNELHMAPVSGAIMDAVDGFIAERPWAPLSVARISFDILGKMPAADFDVRVEVIRPGRTIELLEATMVAGGRSAVLARIWLLADHDTVGIAGGQSAPLPRPEGVPTGEMTHLWDGGFIASLDVRHCEPPTPGRGRAWVTTDVELVSNQPVSDLARFIGLADTANGVAVRRSPREWMFPNVDLTIHLYRQPRGRWIGLDTSVTFGTNGHGLTSSVLHDIDGPVGRAEQILTVRSLAT